MKPRVNTGQRGMCPFGFLFLFVCWGLSFEHVSSFFKRHFVVSLQPIVLFYQNSSLNFLFIHFADDTQGSTGNAYIYATSLICLLVLCGRRGIRSSATHAIKERGSGQTFSIFFWKRFSQDPLRRYQFRVIFNNIVVVVVVVFFFFFLLLVNVIEFNNYDMRLMTRLSLWNQLLSDWPTYHTDLVRLALFVCPEYC